MPLASKATIPGTPIATSGLHHLTAIATRPQGNIEFYVRLLGLRLVKRTVNYDDPQTYHFYFGDVLGRPGSLLTFFPWPGAGPAVRGTSEAVAVALRVPQGALPLWRDRLDQHRLEHRTTERFGEEVLTFSDPDGVPLELVEAPVAGAAPANWPGSPVADALAVQGLHSATVIAPALAATAELLEALGMQVAAEEPAEAREGRGAAGAGRLRRVRFAAGLEGSATYGAAGDGTYLDLLEAPERTQGRLGAGSLHHVALRVADEAALEAALGALRERGLQPTGVKNRNYFKSVYFQEPGGAIFELATDPPGFTVDEPEGELGLAFRLPEWLESERDFLRARLPVTASPEYTDRLGGS